MNRLGFTAGSREQFYRQQKVRRLSFYTPFDPSSTRLRVIAIMHHSREPTYWQDRILTLGGRTGYCDTIRRTVPCERLTTYSSPAASSPNEDTFETGPALPEWSCSPTAAAPTTAKLFSHVPQKSAKK